MNKILKLVFSFLVAIVIFYFSFFIYQLIRYGHSVNWETSKQYTWILKDSVKNELNTGFSYVQRRDVYTYFRYDDINSVHVWDFKDLNKLDLRNISFNEKIALNKVEFRSGEIMNKRDYLEIHNKYGSSFNNGLNVNLDECSNIERTFETDNYKGFYGSLNRLSLSNKLGEHQIIFDYSFGIIPTVFLLYKGHESFFVIIINSEEPFDESIINILNLD